VVIASFVTIVQMLLEGFLPQLNASLGIFIPLIVVNCIILARAEAFASKNTGLAAVADGLGMGAGFTAALLVIGSVREFLGNGSWFGLTLLDPSFPRTVIMLLPPGAFITLGCLIALLNYLRGGRRKEKGAAQ
jgi:electron transport complex protein RnfE